MVSAYSRLSAIAAAAEGGAGLAVKATVANVEASAKARAAVDTGNMRNSVSGRMTGATSGEVVAGAEYSVYVEFGTSRMGAQPFMVPAAESQRAAFIAMMAQVFAG